MALLDTGRTEEARGLLQALFAAFAAATVGGVGGVSALRAVTGARAVGRVAAGEEVGEAMTTFEQAFVAGKVAATVGTNTVRKMSVPQLQRAVAGTPVAQLTEAEQVILATAKTQSEAALRTQLAKMEAELEASVAAANAEWEAQLAMEEWTAEMRALARAERLAMLEAQIQAQLLRVGSSQKRLLRTEMSRYMQRGQVADAAPEEVVYKVPRPTAEFHCMRLHLNPDGSPKRYRLRDVIGNSNLGVPPSRWMFVIGPVHPFCVLPGTRVDARDVEAVSERRYEGEVVVFRTASGKHLSVTPNHPVLTDRGWLAAGLLHEGCYVVRGLRREREAGEGYHHEEDVPVRVEQVAETFRLSPTALAYQVPGSPEQFHGDGVEGQVGAVWSDRLLRRTDQAALHERLVEGRFVEAVEASLLFAFSGFRRELVGGPGLPPEGFVGSGGAGTLHFVRLAAASVALGFHETADLYPGFDQSAAYDGAGDAERARQAVLRLTGQIALDEVVQVDRERYSGHVYNLQTREGWYFSNDIASKNCYCILHRERLERRPGPNQKLAAAREERTGGTLFPSDSPQSIRRSQAARRGVSRTGQAGAGRRFGDDVVPATQAEMASFRQFRRELSHVRRSGLVTELEEVSTLALSIRDECPCGEKDPPEEVAELLDLVKRAFCQDGA